jgi:hypothetical protein
MSDIDKTDVILAGLGIGGFLWMNHKLTAERRARVAAEQARDCAQACATRSKRPSNGLTRASAPSATAPRLAPRTFDPIFAAYGQGIPVPYLRALALRESDMNPRSASGPAWGLLQVIEVVRQDHNQRTGSRFMRQDLLDPVVNVTIAANALVTIMRSYAQHHPRVRNLQADWNNPRFAELLTFSWNAGWSERGGVGRVSSYLEQRGVLDQTIDTIHQASRAAGASPHLANAAKVAWSKSVAAQYFRELAADQRLHGPVIEMPEDYVGRGPVIEMPEDYVGRPTLVMTGPPAPITQPSQVTTIGPITSPSQVSAPEPRTPATSQVAVAPTASTRPGEELPLVPAVALATASAPSLAAPAATNPSGLGGPINPYDDCACST